MDITGNSDIQAQQVSSSSAVSQCILRNIERMSYSDALDLQHYLHNRCVLREVSGALVLLEHDPVITKGVKTGAGNVHMSAQALNSQGITLVETDRGGDVTYHGPGQLVGYPILRIRELGLDLHSYLRNLEQSIINAIGEFGLRGDRNGPAGVWVGEKKVCSIGIAVRKWVTYHGFALNVDPIMSHFSFINPCGLASEKIISLAELLGATPSMTEVREVCARSFAEVFGLELIPWRGDE